MQQTKRALQPRDVVVNICDRKIEKYSMKKWQTDSYNARNEKAV